jgi:GABA(A) receptor-associated protein
MYTKTPGKNLFQEGNALEKRKVESDKMLTKYPERVPIICMFDKKILSPATKAGHQSSRIKEIQKFLAPKEVTLGQFIMVIRRKLYLSPSESVFVFVEDSGGNGKILCPGNSEIGSVYDAQKNKEDSFLYFHVTKENTFG